MNWRAAWLAQGPVIITVTEGPDERGRCYFTTRWPAGDVGGDLAQTGMQGQVSHAELDPAVQQWRDRGRAVIVWGE